MIRELNKNEFIICKRAMDNASELLENKLPKQALLELKPARKLLQRNALRTRMAALCLYLSAKAQAMQNKKVQAQKDARQAMEILASIGDDTGLAKTLAREFDLSDVPETTEI